MCGIYRLTGGKTDMETDQMTKQTPQSKVASVTFVVAFGVLLFGFGVSLWVSLILALVIGVGVGVYLRKPDEATQPETPTSQVSAPAVEPTNATAPAAPSQLIKPSAPLAGQAELATRKGSWRYTPEKA
jgi:hypothetical protein